MSATLYTICLQGKTAPLPLLMIYSRGSEERGDFNHQHIAAHCTEVAVCIMGWMYKPSLYSKDNFVPTFSLHVSINTHIW